MKIALFSDSYESEYGGLTVYVRRLVKYLNHNGHKVKVFTWDSDNLTAEDKKICVTFPAIRAVNGVRGKAGFAPLKICQEAKKFSPDIIHNHSQFTMGINAIWVAKKLHIPLFQHYHAYLNEFLHYFPYIFQISPKAIKKMAEKVTTFFFNRSDIVIAPSKAVKKYLIGIGVNKKIQIVPFGINLKDFKPSKSKNQQKNFTLLYCGRLSKEKKVDKVIKIFNQFAQNKPARLKIIGDGPEKVNLTKLAKSLKNGQKVKFKGWVTRKKLPKEYSSASIFMTLSEMETFGIVVVEAMACGLPVIGSNALAIPELIIHGENGYLVNGSHQDDVIDKLNRIYYDKKLRMTLSENSLKFAKRFEEANIFRKLEHIYQSAVSQKCHSKNI